MTKNKFLNLFSKEKVKATSPEPSTKEKQDNAVMDKKLVQELRNLITKKLKDPSMAKKAAQIIEEMIQEKTNSYPKQNQYSKKKKSA
jgi:hypothetical protein